MCLLLLIATIFLSGQEQGVNDRGLFETNFSGVIGSGARALGMGGAFIAIADDATAATWNPGGLGQLETPEFSLGMRFQEYRKVSPASGGDLNFTGAMDMNTQFTDIDFIAFTYPIRFGNFKIVPQVIYQRGISFNFNNNMNPVGYYGNYWDAANHGWMHEYGTLTETQKVKGGLDFYSFSIGSSLFKRLNVGVSVNFWTKGYYANHTGEISGVQFPFEQPSAEVHLNSIEKEKLDMDVRGVNFTLGVLVDVSEQLKIGAVYKNAFNATIKYSLKRETNLFIDGANIWSELVKKDGDASLTWPETVGFGISFRPSDPLTLSADFTRTSWNNSVIAGFPYYVSGTTANAGQWKAEDVFFPTLIPKQINTFKQLETRQLRLGMEYVLIGSKTLIPLRLGLFTDSQYYPDTSGRPITFFGLTGGLGMKWKGLSTDLAVIYEIGSFLKATADYSETRISELRVYLSTSYSF